jgi:hypothetical protein
MITEDYCSYEVAKLLKEKGFEILTGKVYDNQNKLDYQNVVCWQEERLPYISAPTHQMAMKWLREIHNICITIYPDKERGYEAVLYNIKDDVEILLQSFGIYGSHIFEDSYKGAVEAALKYALENLI